jgi:hypothetical protein
MHTPVSPTGRGTDALFLMPQGDQTMTEFRDVYSRSTNKIIADLEQDVWPWMQPWSADHAAGRITRPMRHNGIPYNGINVVMLWSASVTKGYACPLWLSFRQARKTDTRTRNRDNWPEGDGLGNPLSGDRNPTPPRRCVLNLRHPRVTYNAMASSRTASIRAAKFRDRQRTKGLRPATIWIPDIRDPAYRARLDAACRELAALPPAAADADAAAGFADAFKYMSGWL